MRTYCERKFGVIKFLDSKDECCPMYKALIGALVGGVIGGCLVWYGQTRSLQIVPLNMTYSDFAAILLTAVSVLVTVLGVFIAALAIWGYSQFKTFAQNAAKDHVSSQLKDGELRTHIEEVAEKFLESDFSSGKLRKLIEERIDYVIYSGAAQRAASEERDANEEEGD